MKKIFITFMLTLSPYIHAMESQQGSFLTSKPMLVMNISDRFAQINIAQTGAIIAHVESPTAINDYSAEKLNEGSTVLTQDESIETLKMLYNMLTNRAVKYSIMANEFKKFMNKEDCLNLYKSMFEKIMKLPIINVDVIKGLLK